MSALTIFRGSEVFFYADVYTIKPCNDKDWFIARYIILIMVLIYDFAVL